MSATAVCMTCGLPVSFEYLLKLSDVIILVGLYQVGHGQDLWVVLVRLGLHTWKYMCIAH